MSGQVSRGVRMRRFSGKGAVVPVTAQTVKTPQSSLSPRGDPPPLRATTASPWRGRICAVIGG
jgi:hypothetical protein